jgi:hypothetical protein
MRKRPVDRLRGAELRKSGAPEASGGLCDSLVKAGLDRGKLTGYPFWGRGLTPMGTGGAADRVGTRWQDETKEDRWKAVNLDWASSSPARVGR